MGKFVFLTVTVLCITVILLVGGWFYWFEYRVSEIRTFCSTAAQEHARMSLVSKNVAYNGAFDNLAGQGMFLQDDYKNAYETCLRQSGVETA